MSAICPTDVVEAPVGVVWRLLMDPAGWGGVFDVRIIRVDPPGPARVGQQVHAESGPKLLRLGVGFEFTRIDETQHRLGMEVRFPFRVTVTEDMNCAPLGDDRCRVTYGCDFGFAPGWRGSITRALLSRRMRRGPAASLARLKAAAERVHRLNQTGDGPAHCS
jgi:hypothetical protein